MITALRGMKDLMGEDARKYSYIIETLSKFARNYGFDYIETPILEETRLFKRTVGESSDIVGKEMYRFTDKGGNDVCLRPEGTAGVVRAFIQAKLDRQQGFKGKYFYYGPMFRYERPQKGRLRQFHQFGVESFGEGSVYEDFTLIQMLSDTLKELGIESRLKINSLGCPECMPEYRNNLVGFLEQHNSQLCEDCQRRIGTNPIRVLDCKNENCKIVLEDAPKLANALCENCQNDIDTLQKLLKNSGIAYEYDSNLVRGLDYYSKTAFEFVSDALGAQSAVAGGGRYDKLVEHLDGRATPAVGYALGIERIMELVTLPQKQRNGYYLGAMLPEALPQLLKVAKILRKSNKTVVEYQPKGLKGHLKAADRQGYRYLVMVGEDELKNNELWIKDLEEKEEQKRSIEDFLSSFQS